MERSSTPTSHIIIKANSTSNWDDVDFAIIHLDQPTRETLSSRQTMALNFKEDDSFHNLTYWDSPSGYYCNSRLASDSILQPDEDWAFVILDDKEEDVFAIPENQLEAHQLMITNSGYANFKAYSKHTNEEYWTEWFSISHVLKL